MKRIAITPRQNWSKSIEALGFDFYHIDGIPYWHEAAYYDFSAAQIDEIEAAANELHRMCLRAVERIISERLYPLMGIEIEIGKLIQKSWEARDPAIYGRFDFLYDGVNPPKLLEYNADTPSSLFEASIVQWYWLLEVLPERAAKFLQFNSIEESLTARWGDMLAGRYVQGPNGQNLADRLFVTTAAGGTAGTEDVHTVQYMGSIAEKAGFKVQYFPIQEMGWNGVNFTNLGEEPIRQIFKLYPWEWLINDTNGWSQFPDSNGVIQPANFEASSTIWWEPKWKMLLSNKGILPILWDMFPEHENLLPAYRNPTPFGDQPYVQKPLLGREGANITMREGSKIIHQTGGNYAEDRRLPGSGIYIYQGMGQTFTEGNIRANLGVWMANDKACGMGVREDDSLVVTNNSRFVPHTFL